MLPANDNTAPTRADRLIASTLTSAAVIEEHLRVGLQAMLKANDVPTVVRDAVADFMRPAIDRLAAMEGEVVQYAQADKSLIPHLEHFRDEFGKVATTRRQKDLVNDFRDFVEWAGSQPGTPMPVAVVTAKVVEPNPFPLPANDWRDLLKDQPQRVIEAPEPEPLEPEP